MKKFGPIKEVIPREIPTEIASLLNHLSDIIDSCVDFGSNIIVWDNTGGDWIDNTPPIMLFRHFLELIDSISILIGQSSIEPAKHILRSALESYFSILFIIKDNSRQKSTAFIVSSIFEDIYSLEKMIKIKKNAGDYDNRRVRVNETDFTLEEILEGRKRILESSEEFKLVYKEFERLKKSKNNKITYPKWYSVFDGPKSIWGLATELRQEDLYEHLYTNLSSNTHSSDVISGKMSTDLNDKAEIIQLRSWQNANTVTKLTLSITILVFREYIDKRIPKYNTEYKEWFATIRDDFSRL